MQTLLQHPKSQVFGVVDRSEDVTQTLEELERRGVPKRDIQVIRKDADPQATEAEEGGKVREGLTRAVDMLSEEHEFNEMYQAEVEAGHALIGVHVSDTVAKQTVHDVLIDQGAHSVSYYGRWVVEGPDE